MVDLDPECRDGEIETLWQELWTSDGEEEVAFRSASRMVSDFPG